MPSMEANFVGPAPATPGVVRTAMALAWASMVTAVVSLLGAFLYLAMGGQGLLGLALNCLLVVSALGMAGLAMWLLPKGQPHHDFAIGTFRTTLLFVGFAALFLLVTVLFAPLDWGG